MLGGTVNVRAVRILLECNLVVNKPILESDVRIRPCETYPGLVYSIKIVVFQNLTDDQIDDASAAYEPANITNATATKIAISDMVGDIMFACPAEVFALVNSFLFITSNDCPFGCPIICTDIYSHY